MQVGASAVHPTRAYMTTAMLRQKGTGLALDTLVPSGTTDQQDDALAGRIRDASAEMDSFCYGLDGVLYATVDTEVTTARLRSDGAFRLAPRLTPVRALVAFAYGTATLQPVPDLSTAQVEPGRIIVPGGAFTGASSLGPLQFGDVRGPAEYRVEYSYVHGWPVAKLAAPATAGTPATLEVDDPTGIFEGGHLTIRDPQAADETVRVTAVNGSTVTVASLAVGHAAGVQADGLPDVLIDACTEITTGLLKRKAQEGVRSAARTDGRRRRRAPIQAGEHHFARGLSLLTPYARTW